jgi:hypothetical protein
LWLISRIRSEASLIPTLLVAPAGNEIGDNTRGNDKYDDENDDDKYFTGDSESQREQVVYHDGVWIAIDEERNDIGYQGDKDDACDTSSPQQEYYKLLLKRFRMHQGRLTDPILCNTDRTSTTNLAHDVQPKNKSKWLQMIDQNNPTLDLISRLNETALYQAIQNCSSSLSYSRTITRQKSCWIWTLLALVGDVGTLDHGRISKLRDLGAQAGRLGTRLRGGAPPHDEHGNEEVLVVPDESMPSPDDHQDSNETQNADGSLGGSGPGTMETRLRTKATDHDDSQPGLRSQHQDGERSERCLSQSDADMSLSEDGSEVHEVSDAQTLEQARARLLAQLGDRLVQPRGSSQVETSNSLKLSSPGHSLQGHTDAGQQIPEIQLQQVATQHEAWSSPASENDHDIEASSTVLDESDTNTRATIDMILTIVAECYGQKDLLEFRGAW